MRSEQTDPFSIGAALIGYASAASGVVLGAEAFAIAAPLVGSIAVGAAITGANYAINATLAAKKSSAGSGVDNVGGVNTPEVRGSVRQSTPGQKIVYGQARVGGAIYFLDDSKPPALYLGLLISARRISQVRGVLIGANVVPFPIVTNNRVLPAIAGAGQFYVAASGTRLFACFRDGSADQTISALLAADFPNLDTSFRQQGIACADFKFLYGADRADFEQTWGQVAIPNPLLDVDGATVYDPRDPLQRYPTDWRDKEDVAAAMATWRYSNTAALVQGDWLGAPYGVKQPPDRIDWDKIAESADFDEEPVVNLDGSARKRHTIDGVVTLDQSPRTTMEAMLTANRGFLVQSQGRGWLLSSQPRAPVLTIDDAMMAGPFEFRDDRATADQVNRLISRFSSADREYQDIDGPVLDRADLQALDGEELSQSVRLPFTSSVQAVESLSKQYLEEARLPRAWSGPIKIKALGLKPGDCVRIDSQIFPRMNGLYTVDQLGYVGDFSGLQLTLNEYDPTIATDFVAALDEKPFTLPALNVS